MFIVSSVIHSPRCLEPLREPRSCPWMCVVAQGYEVALCHGAIEPEHYRPFASPLSDHALCLCVVITDSKMLLEVRLRILQVRLRLRREHALEV